MTKVLAISGSLRDSSYNTMLLRNAVELFGDDVVVEELGGLKDVPPYDEDDDGDDDDDGERGHGGSPTTGSAQSCTSRGCVQRLHPFDTCLGSQT